MYLDILIDMSNFAALLVADLQNLSQRLVFSFQLSEPLSQ